MPTKSREESIPSFKRDSQKRRARQVPLHRCRSFGAGARTRVSSSGRDEGQAITPTAHEIVVRQPASTLTPDGLARQIYACPRGKGNFRGQPSERGPYSRDSGSGRSRLRPTARHLAPGTALPPSLALLAVGMRSSMEYWMYALLQLADDETAENVLVELRSHPTASPMSLKSAHPFAGIPARYFLERRQWKAAASLESVPADLPVGSVSVCLCADRVCPRNGLCANHGARRRADLRC